MSTEAECAAMIDGLADGLPRRYKLHHHPGRVLVSLIEIPGVSDSIVKAEFESTHPANGQRLWVYAATQADFDAWAPPRKPMLQ